MYKIKKCITHNVMELRYFTNQFAHSTTSPLNNLARTYKVINPSTPEKKNKKSHDTEKKPINKERSRLRTLISRNSSLNIHKNLPPANNNAAVKTPAQQLPRCTRD